MKTFWCLMLMLAIALMLGGTALAQGDNSDYFTVYYSNANTANAPDATVRVINDGGATISEGCGPNQECAPQNGSPLSNLYASIYVFDDSEELTECCSCLDRKSTRLNSSHLGISYAVFCLKKKKKNISNSSTRSLR